MQTQGLLPGGGYGGEIMHAAAALCMCEDGVVFMSERMRLPLVSTHHV